MTDKPAAHSPRTRSKKRDILFAFAALFIVLIALEGFSRWFENRGAGKTRPEDLNFQHDINDLISLLEMDPNLHQFQGGPSMYMENAELIWKLRPNFKGQGRDNFAVEVPDNVPAWSFSINNHGFRGHDFDEERRPGVYRVVALGDSCTFGFGVDQGDSYPAQLENELNRLCPVCTFEVINMGVAGYSSRQGLELARQWLKRLSPQVVIISYGTNDSGPRSRSDADEIEMLQSFGAGIRRRLDGSALFRGIDRLLAGQGGPGVEPSQMVKRVSVENYRKNIDEIAKMATTEGATVILLDTNFFLPYGTNSLKQIAARHPDYGLLDTIELLAEALQNREKIEKRFPNSTKMSLYYHQKIIARWPTFLLMVDPMHPNAMGYRIIAEVLASNIINTNEVRLILNEKIRYSQSLPPLKRWALFKDRTSLEKRTAELNEQSGP